MFSLPMLEISRFRRALITKLALLVVVLIPTLYAGVYLSANWDPTGDLHELTAAVVNEDEPASVTSEDGTTTAVHAGDDLVDKLVGSSDAGFTWVETDANEAQAGLDANRYNAVLTIPRDMSSSIASFGGEDPRTSTIDISTNDAQNYIVGNIASTVLAKLGSQLRSTVIAGYLDNVYVGFNTIHSNLADAVDGSAQLRDGSVTLRDGLAQLDAGAGQLVDGAGQLRDGLNQAGSGAVTLTDGSRQIATGTQQLSTKADEITSKVDEVTGVISAQIDPVANDLSTLVDTATTHAADLQTLADQLSAAAAAAPDDSQLQQLAQTAQRLAQQASTTVGDGTALKQKVDTAATTVQNVVDEVKTQVDTADSQISQLNSGAGQVADGAATLQDGITRLSTGAEQLATGTVSLKEGTASASDGSSQLADGAAQLADGLRQGVAKIPTYSDSDRDSRSSTVAAPVDSTATRQNAVSAYGEGLAPFFLSVSLWVGGMITYMVLRAAPVRAYASRTRSWRIAVAGYLPGVLFGILQALTVCMLLFAALGVTPPNPWLFLGFATLVSVSFAAIHQALVALLGGVGRLAALVLLVLQLASAGGTYPIQTAPPFFQWLHGIMPLSYSVQGFRALMAGTDLLPAVTAALFLLLMIPLSLLLATFSAHRKRLWTVARLHPSLQL